MPKSRHENISARAFIRWAYAWGAKWRSGKSGAKLQLTMKRVLSKNKMQCSAQDYAQLSKTAMNRPLFM